MSVTSIGHDSDSRRIGLDVLLHLKNIFSFQVSHHPPAAAHHAISDRGWTLRQEITVASKFRGKYLSIMPLGKRQASLENKAYHSSIVSRTKDVHTTIIRIYK